MAYLGKRWLPIRIHSYDDGSVVLFIEKKDSSTRPLVVYVAGDDICWYWVDMGVVGKLRFAEELWQSPAWTYKRSESRACGGKKTKGEVT